MMKRSKPVLRRALMLLLLLFVSHSLPAQDWMARLFKSGKYARYKCASMGAYNKHRKGRLKKEAKFRTTQNLPPGTITQARPRPNLPGQPPPSEPSSPKTAPPTVAKADPPTVPLTEMPPVAPPGSPEKITFRKLNPEERRKQLLTIPPELELPPIRFVTAQDEFSVVNMDSFMQAMEYAQQGKIVLIEGHTDDLGNDDSNLKLSMKRAEKIRQLMLSGGVSDDQLSVIGFGEDKPLVPNTSDKNRAVNRRIEFKIFSVPE